MPFSLTKMSFRVSISNQVIQMNNLDNLKHQKKELIVNEFHRLLKEEDYKGAKEILKVLEKHSTRSEYAQFIILYGRETENIEIIRMGYERLIRIEHDPAQKRVLIRSLAKAEIQAGNINTAKAMYNELLKGVKNSSSIMLAIGKLEEKVGNKNKARQYFNEVKLYGEFFGDNKRGHNILKAKLANAYLDIEDGNFKSAYKSFDSIVKSGGRYNIYALGGIAKICALTGDAEKAKQCFYKAIELSLKLKDYKIRRLVDSFIQYLIRIEDYEEAEKVKEKYKDSIKKSHYRLNNFAISKAKGDLLPEDIENQHALAIKHITEGHADNFDDVEDLYYKVLNKMTSIDPDPDMFKWEYYISCEDYTWTIDGEKTNCILVATLGDKTNIITMYPVIWYGDTIKLNQKVKEKA